ncbi:MAG: aromatic ring-hydroxylating dioxygenase subunit alpha [Novosphingobium sp.]
MDQPRTPFRPVEADDLAWLGTDPVPAAPYYDPAWYEDERKAVFLKSWIQVGHQCEVPEPGSFIRRDLEFAKASLLIVRGKDGEVRAFHNVCTHRGTQLVQEAAGRRSKFSCPYHMWTYGPDGALLSAPDFEAFGAAKQDCALPGVRLESCGGLLFVNFDPAALPLREWLGPYAGMLDEMPVARATTFTEYAYEMAANWKLTYDNFQENYHLRFVHPLSGGAGIGEGNPFGYPESVGFNGPHRTQRIWSNPAPQIKPFQGRAFARAFKAAAARGIVNLPHARDYLALFPNFFIIGTPSQHFSHTVYPLGPGRSRGVIRLYWVGEDATASERFAREHALASLRDIHSEDISMIEAGQRGLESGALTHIRFQTMEALCRHLYNGIDERVSAYRAEQAA